MNNIINKTIYCKDNLDVLRGINSNTIDMIYLDPPFNKNKSFTAPMGTASEGASFKDIFGSNDIDPQWMEEWRLEYPELYNYVKNMYFFAQQSDASYIQYMAVRILECRRILKETGTLFYHCDHTMNDYIKIMLDIIFGRKNDINNLVWSYDFGGRPKDRFARKHDNIFWFAKGKKWTFNADKIERLPYKSGMVSAEKKAKGKLPTDVWEMPIINTMSKERTGYPTQKPLHLLRRIITASTNEEDMILDPFAGCATACVAAEQLNRRWIGIDISEKAYELVKERLKVDAPSSLFSEIPVNFTTIPPKRTLVDERDKKWIYIISNDNFDGEYKVGIATNWKSRLNSYQTSDPNRAYKLEYKVLTPDYLEIEKAVHDHFDNRHEWVRAELKDIKNYINEKINI